MLRRQQMEREIEQHELERNQTAHPLSTEGGGDDLEEQVKKFTFPRVNLLGSFPPPVYQWGRAWLYMNSVYSAYDMQYQCR